MVVPRHVLGGVGFTAPSDTVVVGMIGAGGMGAQNASHLVGRPDVRFGAIADIDMAHVAASVARQDNGAALQEAYTASTRYADFREMLDRETGLDGVVIATPDHVHAVAALHAMGRGRHVYVQKPLTYTVDESRRLARAAAATGVVTQMGNQGHSGDDGRRVVEVVRAGVLGEVREVHAWTNRPNGYWPQGVPAEATAPVPPGVAWDLFVGPAEATPYRTGLHPFAWRGAVGFGVGSLGDMGAHLLDFPVWALGLGRPDRVETRHTPWGGDAADPATYPLATVTTYRFPRLGTDPLRLTWTDGGLLPPTPENAPSGFTLNPDGGVMIVGERGTLLHETYGSNPRFLPESLAEEAAAVPRSLTRVVGGQDGHEGDWIQAIRDGRAASCPFDYAAGLNETMLLGVAAMRAGQPLLIDPASGAITNVSDGDRLLTRTYRAGWELPEIG